MLDGKAARKVINAIFEEEALVLGGLDALHDIEDDLIWRLIRSFDAIRRKALRQIEEKEPNPGSTPVGNSKGLRPHPAIEEFLAMVRRG